ncbi:hypothetical protein FA041_24980 [Escherichia coli]|nr:hypothetical protein [Escherichia coli]MBW9313238.1 hypothetical protein [Escherichia coli]
MPDTNGFVSYPVNNLTSGNKYFFHRICEHDHDYSSRKCDLCRKISINRPFCFIHVRTTDRF